MLILMSSQGANDDLGRPGVVRVAERFPSLAASGVAVEHFARYVNAQPWPHQVDVVLFTCVLSGSGTHRLSSAAEAVRPGSVAITLYNQTHDLQTDRSGMEVVNVYLDLMRHPLPLLPGPWDRILAEMLPPHRNLVTPLTTPLLLQFKETAVLRSVLEWLAREQTEFAAGRGHLLSQALQRFLVEVCRQALRVGLFTTHPRPGAHQPHWISEVRALIDRQYHRPIGIADMVQIAGVSPPHLCRRFKQAVGLPPVAYLTQRRIQAAAWLLRTTPLPVTEIAWRSGFSELSHFNRKFKQSMAQSPSAYRRGDAATIQSASGQKIE